MTRDPHHRSLAAFSHDAPLLSGDDEARLFTRYLHDGEEAALETLVASHLRLARAAAARHRQPGVSFDDLFSEATVGLLEAARRFDPERGVRFASYARWWVEARIRRFLQANLRSVPLPSTRDARRVWRLLPRAEQSLSAALGREATRSEVAEALGVSERAVEAVRAAQSADVPVHGDEGATQGLRAGSPSPEELASGAEREAITRRRLPAVMATLSPRERFIVQERLLSEESEPLTNLGACLGISRERVRQIEQAAKLKLAAALRDVA